MFERHILTVLLSVARVFFLYPTQRFPGVFQMKGYAIFCALGATAVFSCSAFAQDNSPSATKGLNAGDNVQSAPTHKSTHTRKMKAPKAGTAGASAQPGGTTTPGGPNAPVSASGSGS
ncbi:hypothetical protein AAGS40_15765 [Paraburkholderia sp. PREW-6R]|uniref:hypothetical protein n=1 Tax=Paraburkholderia sp. PREW-6R TaxID=3141544 RepID=UPI0031F53CF4